MKIWRKVRKHKKITFQAATPYAELLLDYPSPSMAVVPKWFKDQSIFSQGGTDLIAARKKGENHLTYKLCVPVTDSFTCGYMLTLPADIIVENRGGENNYTPIISWEVKFEVLDSQHPAILGNYPVPSDFNPTSFRWICDWKIITPKGYSAIFMHPIHRNDLPFFTLSGIVDTDKHPNKLLFPFFIKSGFEGIIAKGTPIVQFLPFKRENWESEKKSFSPEMEIIKQNYMKTNIMRVYKNNIWSRKRYS